MKIFYPLQVFYPSQAGGPANSIYWLAKNLVKKGFEPIIVATDIGLNPDVPLNRWIVNESGKVIYVKTKFAYFPLRQTIQSLLNFYRADVIQLSSIYYPAAFVTAFAARIFKKKIIWSPRGEVDPPILTYSRVRKFVILWGIKWIMGRNYPVFHSTCDAETTYIKNMFGNKAKIVQIPNFIELPPLEERKNELYLLYIGRLHPKKGIENLLNALAMSEDFLKSDFILKISGKGNNSYENSLRQMVLELNLEKKVAFIGQTEGIKKQKLLAGAYWTFMPSYTENFGVVVLESLSQNTPVLASKGTPWAILEKEKIGFWTDNSSETISAYIDKIINMRGEEYEGYRNRSRKFVEREFDIEKNIEKWTEVYDSLKPY